MVRIQHLTDPTRPFDRRRTAVRSPSRVVAWLVVALGCIAGCDSAGSPAAVTTGVDESDSAREVEVIVDGLDHPTQIADGPDGTLLVAQLAGDENERSGEILVIDVTADTRRVVLHDLDKPTGVLWADGALWVMVRRGLVRAEWPGGAAEAGPTTIVLDDLPFNGRSEGTLTPLDAERFLYETSGNIVGGDAEAGSGTLWAFDTATGTSSVVATGIKNGYAHALLGDGRIVTTDIGDNITDPPVDEVVVLPADGTTGTSAVDADVDLGWPQCPGSIDCPGVVRPLSVFPASTTPTGVAVVGDDVYVSLFVTGQLMRTSLEGWKPGDAPITAVQVADQLEGPHTILARRDGTLWISEHLAGRIVAIVP